MLYFIHKNINFKGKTKTEAKLTYEKASNDPCVLLSYIRSAAAMEPARLRTSKGALFTTSLTVSGHESVIQKYVSPFSGFPVNNDQLKG